MMPERVEILDRKEVFSQFIFRVEQVRLRHEKYDGQMSDELTRLNLDRGDSVAAIVHDRGQGTVLLTEQFRFSTFDKGPGWILEIPAGTVEAGEDPKDTVIREIEEEIGYTVTDPVFVATVYVSPGGTSERIHVYYVPVTGSQQTSAGGGVESEGEDIRTVHLPVNEAFAKIAAGEIVDAKTVIGLQWMMIHAPP